MEILGRKALFSDLRIGREAIPRNLIAYELRENYTERDYNEYAEPLPPSLSIAKSVLVDYFGTVLLGKKNSVC